VSDSENPALDSPTPKAHGPLTNQDWWPDQIDVSKLHRNSPVSNPLGEDFDYAKEFAKLDVDALKAEVASVLTTSQDWWPADYGHYGGLMIRLSWHAAGTYPSRRPRRWRAGCAAVPAQQLADNGARQGLVVLWPVKQKYGNKISWPTCWCSRATWP
jgi:catalase-peroxidase